MALPPESLEELLDLADAVCVASVDAIIHEDVETWKPREMPDAQGESAPGTGAIPDEHRQVVRLRVVERLLGEVPDAFLAIKPIAPYLLGGDAKFRGPFFLQGDDKGIFIIRGLYGPNSHPIESVVQSLKDRTNVSYENQSWWRKARKRFRMGPT